MCLLLSLSLSLLLLPSSSFCQMLSETIMHECILRLLKSSSDEESLECFARLITSTGKDLDHSEAKVCPLSPSLPSLSPLLVLMLFIFLLFYLSLLCLSITPFHSLSLFPPSFLQPRIDNNYFARIQDIIRKGKISARTKFMLEDVKELRQNSWVPPTPQVKTKQATMESKLVLEEVHMYHSKHIKPG